MSGHSKWHQIKHKKEAADEKRSALFSKLLKAVSVAAREGPNPDANPRLRTTIEKAREANVPSENIERAISKSAEAKNLVEVTIEAYGPEKSALIIKGITDSKNRTVAEVRHIIEEHGAKFAEPGSVLWSFEWHGGEWRPKFLPPLSPQGKSALDTLTSAIEAHPDVQRVTTNAND